MERCYKRSSVHPVSSQILLLYIENTQGDLRRNGLWKINSDGSGLTRLITAGGRLCDGQGYPATWPQITSNSQSYALRLTEPGSSNVSLLIGSLKGAMPNLPWQKVRMATTK